MEVSGSNGGVVYNQGSQHLELAGTNHQVQLTPEANHPGYYQASVGGQSYEYNSQNHSFSAPGTSEQLSWNASHQQMEAAPGVVYNPSAPSGQHLELAGTNHIPLTPEANNPGHYQASVNGQTYEYNAQSHSFSAPNAPEALSWNSAHQQMEVSGSNGGVVYNQGSQHLELAGTNHQVQLTPEANHPGYYQASVGGQSYEYNSQSHSFSAPGTSEQLSWNASHQQMEAAPGVVYKPSA